MNGGRKIRADCFVSHQIYFHVNGLPDLVFNLHNLEQTFWPGKPDQDINIAVCPASPRA